MQLAEHKLYWIDITADRFVNDKLLSMAVDTLLFCPFADETRCITNYVTPHDALRPESSINASGSDRLNIYRQIPAK